MRVEILPCDEAWFRLRALGADAVVGIAPAVRPQHLAARRLNGEPLWKHPLADGARFCQQTEECWVVEQRELGLWSADGRCVTRLAIELDDHERLGQAVAEGDDLLVSVYRAAAAPEDLTPRVLRLGRSGEMRWATTIPVDEIAYRGVVYLSAATQGRVEPMPPWRPQCWEPAYHSELMLSGDRLLAGFFELRSGLGRFYVLDAVRGTLLWQSDPLPIASAAAVGDGQFLLGAQGYGEFSTMLYADDPRLRRRWNTHGYYLPQSDGRVLALEMANDLSVPQHIVELLGDGSVQRLSERLPRYYASWPVRLADGGFYFWRGDTVWRWDEATGLERLLTTTLGEHAFAVAVPFTETRLGLYVRNDTPANRARQLLLIDLGG